MDAADVQTDDSVTVSDKSSQDCLNESVELSQNVEGAVIEPVVIRKPKRDLADEAPRDPQVQLKKGETLFGVTASGDALGRAHWLADSSISGDLVMGLPSSVLIAARTEAGGGVAVDMAVFLDAIIEGAAKLEGLAGVASASSLPLWAVSRMFGTFPVLYAVFSEALDQTVYAIEGAAYKAALGQKVVNTRTVRKFKRGIEGNSSETTTETLEKEIPVDPALSKMILTSRMKGRYKDEGNVKQAVQINIIGAEARL